MSGLIGPEPDGVGIGSRSAGIGSGFPHPHPNFDRDDNSPFPGAALPARYAFESFLSGREARQA